MDGAETETRLLLEVRDDDDGCWMLDAEMGFRFQLDLPCSVCIYSMVMTTNNNVSRCFLLHQVTKYFPRPIDVMEIYVCSFS